jgi:hypothetical protein
MKRISVFCLAMLCVAASGVSAQESRPFTEGTVTVVTAVDIKDGQYDKYMAYLAKTYKPQMEAQKKAGNILSWSVFDANPRDRDDADVYLTVTYANMAAFDGLDDRMYPVSKEATGMNRDQASQASADRASMRDIIGSEVIREITLK